MIKRRIPILILCLLACALALLTLSACNQEEQLMEHFPLWEEGDMELFMEKRPVEPDIELEFQDIDFETYTTEDGEYMYDEVLIHLRNTGDKNVHKSYHYKIFYLHKDKWYGVYQFTGGTLLAYQASYKPKTEKDISFLVPTGLFDVPGQYKLYYEDTGFCDIHIPFSPNDVSKAKSETTERICQ